MISIKDIKEPENNRWTKSMHQAWIEFIAWLISDKNQIINWKKIFWDISDYILEQDKVISSEYFNQYKVNTYKHFNVRFNDSFLKEFFWHNKAIFFLPYEKKQLSQKPMDKFYTKTIILDYLCVLAKERNIDDLVFNILKKLITKIWLVYVEDINSFAFSFENVSSIEDLEPDEIELEDVLDAEIKQWYVNKRIWDKNREYAYTHALRKHAEFKLFWWSKSVIVNWKKYNVIATSRWQWKSYLAAMLVSRELLNPNPWYGWRKYRDIKYFVPNKEDIGNQVMDYIESMLWDMVNHKLPNWLKAFDINRKWFMVKCNITWNIFKFISLFGITKSNNSDLWTAAWEGIAADFAIIDEAARIPDSFWISFHQRAAFETDAFFIVSTINKETPADHWFYRLLIDAENNDDMQWMRVNIDQNELLRQWKTPREYKIILNRMKDTLRQWGDLEFYSKWYCIVLEQSNVFEVWRSIVTPNRDKYKPEDPRILWFDLWKLTDDCAITLINIKHREIEESIKIKNLQYWDQLKQAKKYKEKFPNTLVIWDRSWVWEAVSEMDTEYIVDVWIKSSWQWDLNFNKKHKYYTCSKWKIINNFASLFHNGILRIPSDNLDFISQAQSFVKKKSPRSEIILYAWKWKKKDDLVLSWAYAALYAFLILWLDSIKAWENYSTEFDNAEAYAYNDNEWQSDPYFQWLY